MRHRHVLLAGCVGLVTGIVLFSMMEAADVSSKDLRKPSSVNSATANTVICRLQTPDMGEIIGRGADKNAAFANAAETCYLKREAQFEHAGGKPPGTDQGEDMAISCINLSCHYDVSSL